MTTKMFHFFSILSLTTVAAVVNVADKFTSFDKLTTAVAKTAVNQGFAITPLWNGYRLECALQDLQVDVTMNGTTIRSTSENEGDGVLSIRAARLGRAHLVNDIPQQVEWINASDLVVRTKFADIVEEYSTSTDGIRQDFIITHCPNGKGDLVLELAVNGASITAEGNSIKMMLPKGREFVYHALKVIDASGKMLDSRFESSGKYNVTIAVNDKGAKYPVHIDPTISDADWGSMGCFPGVSGSVNVITTDNTGNVYIGGNFKGAGAVSASNVAKWDGSKWCGLGNGVNSYVNALVIDSSGNLLAGGSFTTAGGIVANHIAKWNGTTWEALGEGINGVVYDMVIDDSEYICAAGKFDTAGVVTANSIAKWNGSEWSSLGSGIDSSGYINSIAQDKFGNLFIGGYFTKADGIIANNIAKWNGLSWSALGSGVDNYIKDLVIDDSGNLYAGGVFDTAGDIAASRIAKWDGTAWSSLGSGMYIKAWNYWMVNALVLDSSGSLYVGGTFDTAGGIFARYVAKWDGSTWNAVDGGPNGYVYGMAIDISGNIYFGGSFISAGDSSAFSIVKRTQNQWSALGSGTNNDVNSIAFDYSGNLYVGGKFTSICGTPANRIAKWDGSQWSALGSGIKGFYSDAAVYNIKVDISGNIYASGYFDTAGGIAASSIAKWNGTTWSSLGWGPERYTIKSIAVDNSGNLYVGGQFDTIGNLAAKNIAKWDGNQWSTFGSGIGGYSDNGYVSRIVVDSLGNIYAGGLFDSAGGMAARNIAKWDGKEWSALGKGMNNIYDAAIQALAIDNAGNLVAGGYFDTADGIVTRNIAKWNGNAWSSLGSGINSVDLDGQAGVFDIVFDSKGNLYAGGGFDTAGGIPANFIAKWDGSQWSALGSGVDGGNVACMGKSCIYSIVTDNADNLYVCGDFLFAGDKFSPYLARCGLYNTKTIQKNNPFRSVISYNSRSGIINFDLNIVTNATYRILNLNGREIVHESKVISKGSNSLRIKTDALAKGTYIVQVCAGSESMHLKLTVTGQ